MYIFPLSDYTFIRRTIQKGADTAVTRSLQQCTNCMKFLFRNSTRPQFAEKPKTLRECILEDLEKTKYELETAYSGFDNVTDPDLIDCYIYEVNAVMKRYRYLLSQAASLTSLPENESSNLNTETPVNALV